MLNAFLWSFIGALIYILGGWLKQTRQESFNMRKALETLIVAILVALISIAFNAAARAHIRPLAQIRLPALP